MTTVLGIDPGYGTLGWGIIDNNGPNPIMVAGGVIKTPPNLPFPKRLRTIQVGVLQLLRDYQVDCLAIEKPVHGPNVTNSVEVGAAFGAALLAAEEMGVVTRIYWPSQVKAAVCRGNAKKKEVQMRIKIILGLPQLPKPDDAADALAVAVCAANRYVVDSLDESA